MSYTTIQRIPVRNEARNRNGFFGSHNTTLLLNCMLVFLLLSKLIESSSCAFCVLEEVFYAQGTEMVCSDTDVTHM